MWEVNIYICSCKNHFYKKKIKTQNKLHTGVYYITIFKHDLADAHNSEYAYTYNIFMYIGKFVCGYAPVKLTSIQALTPLHCVYVITPVYLFSKRRKLKTVRLLFHFSLATKMRKHLLSTWHTDKSSFICKS